MGIFMFNNTLINNLREFSNFGAIFSAFESSFSSRNLVFPSETFSPISTNLMHFVAISQFILLC